MTPNRVWLTLLGLLLCVGSAGAQCFLCVDYNGKAAVVRNVRNGFLCIKDGEKEVTVKRSKLALVPAPEFMPLFVSVKHLRVKTSYVSLMDSGNDINNTFHLAADFSSPYAVPDLFLVLELQTEDQGKQIYYQGVGDLAPRRSHSLEAHVPLQGKLGEGHYVLHLFSGGLEVFHSEQPWQFREHALDKMVLKRIAGVTEAPPKPLIGPAPDYPVKLLKSRIPGSAKVQIEITRTGAVGQATLAHASDPAFGDAALEAVRQWRFLPRVKDGKPVEFTVEVPFDFTPPLLADTK